MSPVDIATLRRNLVLANLRDDQLAAIAELGVARPFDIGENVYEPGAPIKRVQFPIDAVLSVVAETPEGGSVEAGTVGRDGVTGLGAFLGVEASALRVVCQIPGDGIEVNVSDVIGVGDGALEAGVRRFANAFMSMSSQGAACNRLHPLDQRAARWLLMIDDRLDRNPFHLTHEFFAVMLGSTRPSASLAAGMLAKAGFIRYARGEMEILDRGGLEGAACPCYSVINEEYARAGISLGNRPLTR